MKFDWVIVGAGYSGSILAERIATELNQKVLIIERRNHIGGNAYDYYDEHGILIHKYGPHIFHTNAKHVWDYLSKFTEWRPYYHHVLAVVDGKKVPVPFNLNSLERVFPKNLASKIEDDLLTYYSFNRKIPILKMKEQNTTIELGSLAEYVYEKVFEGYTTKQWELKPEELDASVTSRVPFYISRDDRYFQDKYQGLPLHGYTKMFEKMLNHPNIKVMLNTDYKEVINDIQYDRMVYTGPMDAFFDYKHGELPYRSLRFEAKNFEGDLIQEVGQINYPNEYAYTRISEYKHMTGQRAHTTTLHYEYPEAYIRGKNDPYYPIPKEENSKLYTLYAQEAELLKDKVLFVGRLADYKYYNMDQIVARALTVFEKDILGGRNL